MLPGLYFYVAYFFSGYTIVEGKTLNIEEDKKDVRQLSSGVMIPLGLVAFPLEVCDILFSFIPLVLGLSYLLAPLLSLTAAHLYKQLTTKHSLAR